MKEELPENLAKGAAKTEGEKNGGVDATKEATGGGEGG